MSESNVLEKSDAGGLRHLSWSGGLACALLAVAAISVIAIDGNYWLVAPIALALTLFLFSLRGLISTATYSRRQWLAARDDSRAMFGTLANVAPVGILRVDSQGHGLFANRALAEMLNTQADSLFGDRWLDYLHEDDAEEFREKWKRACEFVSAFRGEVRIRRAGGVILHVELESAPVPPGEGRSPGFLVMFVDVSARNRNQEILKVLATELTTKSGPDYFHTLVERAAQILEVPYAAVGRLALSGNQVLCVVALSPRGIEEGRVVAKQGAMFQPIYSLGTPHIARVGTASRMLVDSKGAIGHCLVMVPVFNERGSVVGHIEALVHDRAREAEKLVPQLQQLAGGLTAHSTRLSVQSRYAQMVKLLPVGLLVFDASGSIMLANERARLMFAERLSGSLQLQGRSIVQLFEGDVGARLLRGGGSRKVEDGDERVRAIRLDGTRFHAAYSFGELPGDESAQLAIAISDVSEQVASEQALKESRDQLEQAHQLVAQQRDQLAQRVEERTAELMGANTALVNANKAKENFLATVSHEIRTPLNGMLGMLELMGLNPLDTEQRTRLRTAVASGRSLARIIDDVLDYSKMEAGKLELRPEPSSVRDLVEATRAAYSANAQKMGLNLVTSVDDAIGDAYMFDSVRLAQILNNLVSNAIKFTWEGSVSITATMMERENDGDVVQFMVRDTGAGIDKKAQARLFHPYEQANVGVQRIYGGTGLGLSICRRLAEMMDADIRLESELGEGTTIFITLKLAPAALPTASADGKEASGDESAVEFTGCRVLAVDDHPTNRELIRAQLSTFGIDAVVVNDGREAIERWHMGPFDLIISDCHMPNMDGYELAEAIRREEEHERKPRTPIIGWTAAAFEDDIQRCHRAGMDDHLPKPAEMKALKRALSRWLIPSKPPESAPKQADTRPSDALGIDPHKSDELKALSVEQWNADLAQLRAAMSEADFASALLMAHRLRSTALLLADAEQAGVAQRAEAAAAQKNRELLTQAVGILQPRSNNGGQSKLPGDGADATSASSEEPIRTVIDRTVLAAMVGDDPTLQLELIGSFFRNADPITASLKIAMQSGDLGAAGGLAHKLKSSARAVGARQLGEACEVLEKSARRGESASAESAYQHWQVEWQRADRWRQTQLRGAQ